MRRSQEPFTVALAPPAARPPARRWSVFGFAAIGVFVAAFLLWSGLAPIESAAVAAGSVSLDTNRKQVQHLEGGIVRQILVREGQEVTANQVLIRLDTTQSQSKIDVHKTRIAALEAQLRLVQDELNTVEEMLKKGHATRPRLLALQRRKAELEGEMRENQSQLKAAADMVARADIRAPIAGAIVDLKVHTVGGVIKAGDTLMSIVSKDEPLVIEAQIDPNDIDVVRPGLAAHVRLTPYNLRFALPLEGRVSTVSADRLTDPKSNVNYYSARIELMKRQNELGPEIKLYPGMPAEVIIVTGERSMLAYLAAPIARSFRRAFREE